jgi:hypothetical protein
MRRFFFTIFAIASMAGPALAGEPIKVGQINTLSTAIRNLDGHMVVVKQNGADNVIMIPWDFGSASLRLRLAANLTILEAAAKNVEGVRVSTIQEITKKAGIAEIKPGSPEYDEFQRQYAELLEGPAPGTEALARIKASELKLDVNDIPVTVLSALAPILDNDAGGK